MVLDFLKKHFFLLLAILIAVFGYIYIRAVGNEYTYVRTDLNASSGITDVRIDSDSYGNAEITGWEVSDNDLKVRLRSVAPGMVYLSIISNEHTGIGVFYVHRNGVITSAYFFGDCTGCGNVILCVVIYLVLILIYLVVKYIMLEKISFYSYDNVLYLGLIIYAFFFIYAVSKGIFFKNGIYGAFQQALFSSEGFVIFTFPLVITPKCSPPCVRYSFITSSLLFTIPVTQIANTPSLERIKSGCGSVSLIQPIAELPFISSNTWSNFVRKGDFSIL